MASPVEFSKSKIARFPVCQHEFVRFSITNPHPKFAMKLLISIFVVGYWAAAFSDEIVGVATVVDGDSIRMADTEIRLQGIDAPEGQQFCRSNGTDWACGEAARKTLHSLSAGAQLRCTWSDRDRYNRPLATCFKKDTSLNQTMISAGMALAYRRYSDRYVSQENEARKAKRGIWNSTFVPPWEWRRCVRLVGNERREPQCSNKESLK